MRQRYPHGDAQRAAEMGRRRIDRDEQVHVHQRGGQILKRVRIEPAAQVDNWK